MLRPVVVPLVTTVVGLLGVGEGAVAAALVAACDGAAGCVDGGDAGDTPVVRGMGDWMVEPFSGSGAAGGTDNEDGAAYPGVADGGVGDALGLAFVMPTVLAVMPWLLVSLVIPSVFARVLQGVVQLPVPLVMTTVWLL